MAKQSGRGRFLIISAAPHAVGVLPTPNIRARVVVAFDHTPRLGTGSRK